MSQVYLDYIRGLPCCNCQADPPSHPHHCRFVGEGGTGLKPPDFYAVPLCARCHLDHWHQHGTFPGMDRVRSENVLLREMVKRLSQWHEVF